MRDAIEKLAEELSERGVSVYSMSILWTYTPRELSVKIKGNADGAFEMSGNVDTILFLLTGKKIKDVEKESPYFEDYSSG